jgi:dTDP-3-amino-2,3,6-trideoxy-4-keto-D-glucose/dTDP-3-amino-3,4,6-trideoxy-alpha-D-glucose/dTDP-2,6-dideoxy-D-kanosamine transaminase
MSHQDRINFPQKDTKFYQSLIDDALQSIINSGQLILGPGVQQFESDFAKWLSHDIEAVHCIGVGNGTDAIELALRAAGIQAGDHVALPSHTAYATVAAVLRVAAIPIFIDVQSDRPVISAETLAHTLSICKSVKAVIAVHLYGEVCDLESIQSLCNLNHLTLIEDCAQATGSLYRNHRVGTFGDFAAFSFYPTKNLGAMGDGGMLVVNPRIHQNQLEIARQMRFYGWNDNREAIHFGVNSRLDEFQALLLSGKLHNLDLQIERRRELAALYNSELEPYLGNQVIDLPSDQEHWNHSYHLYVIQLQPSLRNKLMEASKQAEIPLGLHYSLPCHKHPYIVNNYPSFHPLPNTETIVQQILTLPLNPYLKAKDIRKVCDFIKTICD